MIHLSIVLILCEIQLIMIRRHVSRRQVRLSYLSLCTHAQVFLYTVLARRSLAAHRGRRPTSALRAPCQAASAYS